MRTLIISLGVLGLSLSTVQAQTQFINILPPPPMTRLESFDTNTEVVILKA